MLTTRNKFEGNLLRNMKTTFTVTALITVENVQEGVSQGRIVTIFKEKVKVIHM